MLGLFIHLIHRVVHPHEEAIVHYRYLVTQKLGVFLQLVQELRGSLARNFQFVFQIVIFQDNLYEVRTISIYSLQKSRAYE